MPIEKVFIDNDGKGWKVEWFRLPGASTEGPARIVLSRKGHQSALFDLETACELGAELMKYGRGDETVVKEASKAEPPSAK